MGSILSKTKTKQGQDCRVYAGQTFPQHQPCGIERNTARKVNCTNEKNLKERIAFCPSAAMANQELAKQDAELRLIALREVRNILSLMSKRDNLRRITMNLSWKSKASMPKSVTLNWTNLIFRMHMDKYGTAPYLPVNMFVINLTNNSCCRTWFRLSEDFTFHLAKILIQNIFHITRPQWQIYNMSKIFIENMHESTLPYMLLRGISETFLKELFESKIDSDLVMIITKIFLQHLFCKRKSSLRIHSVVNYETSKAVRTFGEQLYSSAIGEYLTLKITILFTDILNRNEPKPVDYDYHFGLLLLAANKSKLNKKSFLRVITTSLTYVSEVKFMKLPGLWNLFQAKLPNDITVSIAKIYLNSLMSHSNERVVKKAAWTFLWPLTTASDKLGEEHIMKIANKYLNIAMAKPDRELSDDLIWYMFFYVIDEVLPRNLNTKLAILIIRKILRVGAMMANDRISDIFFYFSYYLVSPDNHLPLEVTFDIAHAYLGRLFNSGLPDDDIFSLTDRFVKNLFIHLSYFPCHRGKVFDIAAMFMKTMLESNLSEEATMKIVYKFTYRLCDGNLPFDMNNGYIGSGTSNPVDPDITFNIATMFIAKLHEAYLPEQMEVNLINLLLLNLGLNTLPEELAFDIASMILEYLNKTQLSEELTEKASKILVSAAVQKCALLSFGGRPNAGQKTSGFQDAPMSSQEIYRATVAEVNHDNQRSGWDSDEDDVGTYFDDESSNEIVTQSSILSNTVFNMTD